VSTLAVVLLVLAVVLIALIIGGLVATARRRDAEERRLRADVDSADRALAAAHAADKGWERGKLEAAARAAFADTAQGAIEELHLVQVVDRPGTEDDEAVFRVVTEQGERALRLLRRDGAWVAR
jgi:uncharacterized membrane protein YccC